MMKIEWRVFLTCVLFFFLLLWSGICSAQITAIHINAGWNTDNDVEWFSKLSDCKQKTLLADKDDNQKKYKLAVVPTIILFKDGEEVARFQADLSFKMVVKREDVQDEIDDQLMSDF